MGAARVIVVICISIDVRLIQDDVYNVCVCVCVFPRVVKPLRDTPNNPFE